MAPKEPDSRKGKTGQDFPRGEAVDQSSVQILDPVTPRSAPEHGVQEGSSKSVKTDEELLHEIGERQRAEEALQVERQKFETLSEHAPFGMVLIGKGGDFDYINPKLRELFGYGLQEVQNIEKWFETAYPEPQYRHGVQAKWNADLRALRPGEQQEHTSIVRCSNGEEKIIHFRLVQMGMGALLVTCEDITERKRSVEALQRSEAKYRNILETIADGYHEVDLAGNMVLLNDSLCDIIGYPREDILGRNYRLLMDRDNAAAVYTAYNDVYRTGQPNPGFGFQIRRKDGAKREVSVSISLTRDAAGQPIGFMGIFRDITERRRLEEQLRQAAKMEAIGRLAGGVAHDFNNLLTAIIGYSHMIMQQVAKHSAIHEKLAQIERAADRAAQLTTKLLAFSRKQVLEVKVLNLNEVIAGLEGMLRRIIGEDIELEIEYAPSVGSVRVDPVQIEQILMNLVINSRDAMPAGGRLRLETANVLLDEKYCRRHTEMEPGPYVMIAVSDSGHGMDADTLNRIFDPFFTTKAKGVGTGLGLSTVYGIIKQHRGHVMVYSEPAHGTTFKVFFQLVDATPENDPFTKPAAPHPYGTETVLVVEDEEIVRNLACEALEMLGYVPLAARDPEQALSICTEHTGRIHLLVSDLVLPQMDGCSLFKKLSPHRPDMKVLYVSGYTENFIVHQGILDEGVHFLAKPFTVEALARKVREVLDEPRSS